MQIAHHNNSRASRQGASDHWRAWRRGSHEQPGQAIVELAFSITLLVLLLGAAADLALMYKSYQNLINATTEASTYLELRAKQAVCVGCDNIEAANAEARRRFRNEQGEVMGNIASTLDLNSNGKDDYKESGGVEMVKQMVKIDAADNTQIDAAPSGTFALKKSFNPNATAASCKQRDKLPYNPSNPAVTSCYIVIRAEFIYRPYLLRPILGDMRFIRAISVRRIIS
jgi:hypothetical protein